MLELHDAPFCAYGVQVPDGAQYDASEHPPVQGWPVAGRRMHFCCGPQIIGELERDEHPISFWLQDSPSRLNRVHVFDSELQKSPISTHETG